PARPSPCRCPSGPGWTSERPMGPSGEPIVDWCVLDTSPSHRGGLVQPFPQCQTRWEMKHPKDEIGEARGLTRREAMAAGRAGAASLTSVAAGEADAPTPASRPASRRMPVAFVPHGGGPWPFVDVGFGAPEELAALASHLRALRSLPPTPPRALLVISAHWEE